MDTATLPTRASVLDPEVLAQLDATQLPHEFARCESCAKLYVTMGDRARHLNIDGDCPRDLLSLPGQRVGDQPEWFSVDGHLLRYTVHGLNEDGTPRVWSGGAVHVDHCPCYTSEDW